MASKNGDEGEPRCGIDSQPMLPSKKYGIYVAHITSSPSGLTTWWVVERNNPFVRFCSMSPSQHNERCDSVATLRARNFKRKCCIRDSCSAIFTSLTDNFVVVGLNWNPFPSVTFYLQQQQERKDTNQHVSTARKKSKQQIRRKAR
jgi:hypothetical protein